MSKRNHRKHRRFRFRRQTRPGAAPGTLETHPDSPSPAIHVIAFNQDQCIEEDIENIERISQYLGKYHVTWINVDGLGDAITLQQIGKLFGIHPLALEDVINVHQRAKVEAYDSQLFIVVRMMRDIERLQTEQLSLFLGKNYVLTFQDIPGDCLEHVRERIRTGSGRTRKENADYLAYSIIDAVVDAYFPVVEGLAERLDSLEEEITANPTSEIYTRIHHVKNDILFLRRRIWPHRDIINELARDENPLIRDETRIYLRDCYDHTSQLIDLLEVSREMASSLRDFCMSIVSNRMNEVMKVLTIIATIFIPLSFIAGVYGMNFNTDLRGNMPELLWPYGYWWALGLMLAVALGLLVFFRRKGWIGPPRPPSLDNLMESDQGKS